MANPKERFSVLSPLPIELKVTLSTHALQFFSPIYCKKNCEIIGKQQPPGKVMHFNSMDFLTYLEKIGCLKEPLRHLHRVIELLKQLADGGLLQAVGHSQPMLGPSYTFCKELTNRQKAGFWWLSEALGAEFVYWLYSRYILHITGKSSEGDEVGGTGIAISSEWILTCEHVLHDMKVDQSQQFCGNAVQVLEVHCSPKADVGLLKVAGTLPLMPGLSFGSAAISEQVYSIGYPRVPLSREVVPVMHRGEVTAPEIVSFEGHKLFLYSAIARPGNSGGPLIAGNGRVVGIVTKELSEESRYSGLPFFAGVPSIEIHHAIKELGPAVTLPLEDYS